MAGIKTADLFQSILREQPVFRVVLNLKNWLGCLACREASGMFEKMRLVFLAKERRLKTSMEGSRCIALYSNLLF